MIIIEGGDELLDVAQHLQQAANKMPRELTDDIVQEMHQTERVLTGSAVAHLPNRLAAHITISTVRKGNGAGIVARSPYHIEGMDRGLVVHQVYGKAWASQSVAPGWFTKPTQQSEPRVHAELTRTMDAAAAKI